MTATVIAAILAVIAVVLIGLDVPPLAAVGLVAGAEVLVATAAVTVVALASGETGRVWREFASAFESSLRSLLRQSSRIYLLSGQ